jgi:biopolymer transport protein ExbB
VTHARDGVSLSGMPLWILVLKVLTRLVLGILIGLSIWSISILIDRKKALKLARLEAGNPTEAKQRIQQSGNLAELKSWAEATSGLHAGTIRAALSVTGKTTPESTEAMDRAVKSYLGEERLRLEKGLTVLATLGSNAPFVGLFGTVLGIIQAFGELGQNSGGSGGTTGVMLAISEALVATAIGLLVAIPAVAAYNTFSRQLRQLLSESENLRDQLVARVLSRN